MLFTTKLSFLYHTTTITVAKQATTFLLKVQRVRYDDPNNTVETVNIFPYTAQNESSVWGDVHGAYLATIQQHVAAEVSSNVYHLNV